MKKLLFVLLFVSTLAVSQEVDTVKISLTALTIDGGVELYGFKKIPTDIQFKLLINQLSNLAVNYQIVPVITYFVVDTLPFTREDIPVCNDSVHNDSVYVRKNEIIKLIQP